MRPTTDLCHPIISICVFLFLSTHLQSQCPNNQWDMANIGNAYVDELGNKAIYGHFSNTIQSQFVNDGRLYFFGNVTNHGYFGDGFGYEYIKTCDSTQTLVSGSGDTEFNILDINNTGGVDLKKRIKIKANLQFSNGIVHTQRSISGHEVYFLEGASHLAASDTRHVNGTVSKLGGEPFVFPLGDADHLAQLKVRGINSSDLFTAAYYSQNLDIFQWLAPGSFPVDSMDYNVAQVQPQEFWTLSGGQATNVTLYWAGYSDINLLAPDINDLIVVGWKDGQWKNLGKTNLVQVFNTGTITSESIVPDNYDAFTFGVADSDGDDIPDSQDPDPYDPCFPDATVDACINRICIDLTAGVFLEGAITQGGIGNYGTAMRTNLNNLGYLPGKEPVTLLGVATEAGQPYSVEPWLYDGGEGDLFDEINNPPGVQSYPPQAVDWVLVSLRAPDEIERDLCTKSALLMNDGEIQLTEFFDCCNLIQDAYYIVVQHRNHLPVMSPDPISIVDDQISFDFRTQQSYTLLLGYGQKEINPGVFAMYAGNGDQILAPESSTDININDITLWARDNGKHSGYYFQDYDLNGDVNVHDKALWLLNNGVFTDVKR